MTTTPQLRTVKQLSEDLRSTGGFTEKSLRWLLFHRDTNGLDKACVKIGRRIFIDVGRFNSWLETQRKSAA